MDENVPPIQMDFSKSPFWIQVHDLPLVCMNREVGFKIGAAIGEVEDVDISGEGVGWGRGLRLRVQVDLTKPLERGRALKFNGKQAWVSFRYEKLPHFCFTCGKIFHDKMQCSGSQWVRQNEMRSPKPRGVWLRAEDSRFPSGSYSQRGWRSGRQSGRGFSNQDGAISDKGKLVEVQSSVDGEVGLHSQK